MSPRHRVRQTVSLYEAKTQLSRLVDRAAAGEEIVTAKSGRPRLPDELLDGFEGGR